MAVWWAGGWLRHQYRLDGDGKEGAVRVSVWCDDDGPTADAASISCEKRGPSLIDPLHNPRMCVQIGDDGGLD